MVKVWTGPNNRIGISNGFGMKPGYHPWAMLIYTESGNVRIESTEPDSPKSICGKWKVVAELENYDLKENYPICPTCKREHNASTGGEK